MVNWKSTLEKLVVHPFGDVYRNKRVLITGHSGFKGSWLSLWLTELGALVTGISLPPATEPNHWSLLKLDIESIIQDVRDADEINKIIKRVNPEIVFHLAAQPLVRQSYRDPLETWSTNVMGTANVLETCRQTSSVKAIIVVTTDKCYENQEWQRGYCENDRLGGHDPYSASKACAEMVVASYRNAFFQAEVSPFLATARAGNVIGGGDWSFDRLIPDLIRSFELKQPINIRSPLATRPWQHVLDSLSGYLMLGQNLLLGQSQFSGPWNFGPKPEGNKSVIGVLDKLKYYWTDMKLHVSRTEHPHEANLLYLDCSKAHTLLDWKPVWDIDENIKKTAEWYQEWLQHRKVISHEQLSNYIADATDAKVNWVSL